MQELKVVFSYFSLPYFEYQNQKKKAIINKALKL
jgi:hypothetical protein